MSEVGTLLAQTFTSWGQIPVAGTTVSILEKSPGKKFRLIAVRVTDNSGRIAPIPIPAPPPDASQIPGGETPFFVCDMWVEHPEFQTMTVENIQIFPGVESIQPLRLLPLSETKSNYLVVDRVDITPQSL